MRLLSLTCYLASCNATEFVRKFGEWDIEAIIERLDLLAQQEAQMTALQVLKAIHGLVQSMRVVMDGK